MTTLQSARRGAVRPADKFDARRDELAESALEALGDLGYARTTLRQIASKSAFSHGVVHYYFKDKLELVIYSVRYYKARCVTRYDSVVAGSTTADGLLDAFAAKLAETIREEAPMHRLWYDLRNQSQFEERFRADAADIDHSLEQMIWRIVSRYAELSGRGPGVSPALAYAMLDGVFQHALLRHLSGDAGAAGELDAGVRQLLPSLLA